MGGIPTTELHDSHETTMTMIASGEGVSAGLLAAVIGGVAAWISARVYVIVTCPPFTTCPGVERNKKVQAENCCE